MENTQNDVDSRLIDYAPEYEGTEEIAWTLGQHAPYAVGQEDEKD